MKKYYLTSLLFLLFISSSFALTDRGLKPLKANERTALVIGNSDYSDGSLRNPVNDASDMSKKLKQLGFKVTTLLDANQAQMEDAIAELGRDLNRGGVGLFYYAGHGVQINGENYLIPLNANIGSQAQVRRRAVPVSYLLDEMGTARNGLNIVLLDACRNNPLPKSVRSGGGKGLAKVDAPRGTIVAYATDAGNVASDGEGRNGVFTEAVLEVIDSPQMHVEEVFREVASRVQNKTNGKQVPWRESSFTGEWSFVAGGSVIEDKKGKGVLHISTDPTGALIKLEGDILGKSPQKIKLPKGMYAISASKAKHQSVSEQIEMQNNVDKYITLLLTPDVVIEEPTGYALTVNKSPYNARVRILNITPKYYDGIRLKPDQYHIEVSANGYIKQRHWITLGEQDKTVQFSLSKLPKKQTVKLQQNCSKGDSFTERNTGIEFKCVPAGSFQMGSNNGDSDEKPVHKVTISQSFWMAKTEVTIGQYMQFVNATNSHYPEWLESGSSYNIKTGSKDYYSKRGASLNNTNHPIMGVSWKNANAFINWLNQQGIGKYALPTEAQWEYACRSGGKNEKYAGGSNVDQVGWYDGNSGSKTHKVATKQANGLGLYDMSGNVWEWTADWKGAYSSTAQTDPTGVSSGSDRVVRGGSWSYSASLSRCANRINFSPDSRNDLIGFRPVRTKN